MSKTINKTSFADVFMQFQIEVKRKEIQDYKEEKYQLEDKNQRLMKLVYIDAQAQIFIRHIYSLQFSYENNNKFMYQQQKQLKEEQHGYVCELHKQMKEHDRNLEKKELWNKEQVEYAVQENLKLKHKQENELKDLRCKVARMQVQVKDLLDERLVWLQFKKTESVENQQRIQKLDTHIVASERTYKEMSEYFQRSLALACEEIDRKAAQRSDEIIKLSEKRANENLDCDGKKELKDNEWLKKEVANYVRKISELESTVQKLELENLKHVNTLLNHPSHDRQISVSETLTQISREKSPEMVDTLSCPLRPLEEAEGAIRERDVTPTTPPDLREIHTGPIHLDSLKQKLLCVVGEAVPLRQPQSEPTDENEEMDPSPSPTRESVLTIATILKKLQQLHVSTGGSDE
ncbi:coiled-coil domain-containing protein 83 isoform X2 [Triplophysa dalaica]|uniref:coiled-coil domain-containing protein 83 isoform X2 n=1 Tax=Triplophysa dalaica TaxID=1582913 RepID=UPI0024DF9D4A|nr:coiled-coil domain-containing protein 83 isoform X2 [Triplophysa dalaica]